MTNWMAWAFEQQLGTGEKLVLVYLASLVGAAGVGRYRREDLAAATDYEPRSLQRILKTLRDAGHLQDAGEWYSLRGSVSPDAMPPADLQLAPPPSAATLSPGELEGAGEHLAAAITEAADAHLVRFNDAALRLLKGIERIAIASAQLMPPDPPPPPDPVRESVHFKAFMASGFLSEVEAYELAQKRIEAEQDATPAGGHAASMRIPEAPLRAAGAAGDAKGAGGRSYLDTALGRFERVRDILDPDNAAPWADAMAAWQRLEDAENKHTVGGETDAFELLYPAIVVAARRCAGSMSLAQFLDEKAIKAGRAPWDLESGAGGPSEQHLEAELQSMLNDLERANHPMAQVGPRTVEKDEGRTLTESVAAYHARVKRVHQQLKKLQEMGV